MFDTCQNVLEAKSISFSSDRSKFCVVYSDSTAVGIYDVNAKDDKALQVPVPLPSCACFMSRKNAELVVGTKSGNTVQWGIESGRAIKTYSGNCPVLCIKANYNDAYLACGYGNGNILLHHLETNNISKPLTHPEVRSVDTMDLSLRDRNILACGSSDGGVYVWDIYAAQSRARFPSCHVSSVSDVCYSPVSAVALASGGYDTTVNLFDVRQASIAMTWRCGEGVSSVCFYPDGQKLLIGGLNGAIEQWDQRKSTSPIVSIKQPHRVNCLRFNIYMKSKESCKKVEKSKDSEDVSVTSTAPSDTSEHHQNVKMTQKMSRLSIDAILSPPDPKFQSSYEKSLPNVTEEKSSSFPMNPQCLFDEEDSKKEWNDSSSLFSTYEKEKLEKLGTTTSAVNDRSLSPRRRPLSSGNVVMEEVQELLQQRRVESASPSKSCSEGSPSRSAGHLVAPLNLVQHLIGETVNESMKEVKEMVEGEIRDIRCKLACLNDTIFNQALENQKSVNAIKTNMALLSMQMDEELEMLEEENRRLRELK